MTRLADDAEWVVGRAEMLYRDLIPDRCGGRFIASHIRIRTGGPVPDYVHFHRVRCQLIYCYQGWVRVVYEDQGAPFVLNAGDCVLQPPQIRHRVLECSPGLEVIEIASPADHETRADSNMALPTAILRPEREFAGQRFARHVAADASWQPWRLPGFECRDLGIGAATGGLAGARVARLAGEPTSRASRHDAEFAFGFVLRGELALHCGGSGQRIVAGGCFVVPAHIPHQLLECSDDLELLETTLPAEPETAID